MFTRFSASLQVRSNQPSISSSTQHSKFMKGAFQPASVPITIFVFFLGICITEIHRNSHHGIFGPQIQSDSYRITGELRNVHGGRQWKHQFLGIFDNRFRVNQQSNSEKESNENQYHERNANQRQRFTTRTYPATNQGRTWCICNSVRSNTLATRASSPECYVCKQDIKSYGKWNIIEWEKDYTSPGYCNSIMHICIWETCKVYSVSQEHQRNSSTCECASIHIHGSFINRRANYYSRKNTNLQFRNQIHGTIAISENQFEHEISTNGNAYQLSWEILCETIRCYRCQRFGHLAAACLAKKERCSMCSGHHRTQQCLGKIQNSESVDLKCANCGEKHSANSNHCSVLRENMQRKMNNAMSRILATKQSPPPPVTSTAFPATLTGDIDTRKRVMSDNSVRGVNNYAAAAAKHHVPRSVVLAARGTSKFAASSIKSTVSLMHGSKDNSTEQQSIKMDHRRKRTAAQALKTPATKKLLHKKLLPRNLLPPKLLSSNLQFQKQLP